MDGMDMSSHDHGSSSSDMSSMSMMSMTFFGGTGTSLYSNQFTPTTTGGYAGACIFLIVLTILYRSLFALKAMLEARWIDQALQRRYVVVADKTPESERIRRDTDAKTGTLSTNGVEEEVKVVHMPKRGVMPWRFSVDLPRACLVTVMVGIGYLLYVLPTLLASPLLATY
jgi:solute carrier family 31 (copper transporter), member 1